MTKSVLMVGLMAIASIVPLGAQTGDFTFNMGGGISTPLNPTAQIRRHKRKFHRPELATESASEARL